MELADNLKAQAIRAGRKRLHLKQRELAELIDSNTATICQWESGRRIPRRINWKMLLIAFEQKGITFDAKGNIVISSETNKRKSKKAVA